LEDAFSWLFDGGFSGRGCSFLLFMDGQTRSIPRLDDLVELYVFASKALQHHSLFSLGEESLHSSPKCCLMNSYTGAPCRSRFPSLHIRMSVLAPRRASFYKPPFTFLLLWSVHAAFLTAMPCLVLCIQAGDRRHALIRE
jgi:hypothetical protein